MSAKFAYLIVPVVAMLGLLFYFNRTKTDVHLAIAKNDVARVNELLDQHPELLESRNRKGRTPLLQAVELNRVEIFHALIRRGADANARADDGGNGLHLAAEHDLQDAAKSLVRAGTSTEATNRDGLTPAEVAAEKQNWNIVRLLGGRVPAPNEYHPGDRPVGPRSVAAVHASLNPN